MRVIRSSKKVSFPMPRHGAILNLGGPLANGDHIEDMPAAKTGVRTGGVINAIKNNPRTTNLITNLIILCLPFLNVNNPAGPVNSAFAAIFQRGLFD